MKRTQQLDPVMDRGKRFRSAYKRRHRRAERRILNSDHEASSRRVYWGYSW